MFDVTRSLTNGLTKILFNEAQIQQRVAELGAQISHDYAEQDLLLVCILRGGVVFLGDLMRHITVPCHLDFMAVASYEVAAV